MKKIKRVKREVVSVMEEISDKRARGLIVEVKVVETTEELDCFEKCPGQPDFIRRLFTLKLPMGWKRKDREDDNFLLEYARDNMPDDLTFGA